MVSIKTLDVPAANVQSMVVNKTAVDLSAYVDAFKNLKADKCLEITPDDGEAMRKVKMNVTAAAKTASVTIEYGETDDGMLLVWLKDATEKKARKSRKLSLVS